MLLIKKVYQYKFQLFLIISFSVLAVTFFNSNHEASFTVIQKNSTTKTDLFLIDISDDSVEPKDDKNLFFIDTLRTQSKYDERMAEIIGKRQACAFESAALLNPNLNVYVVYITREDEPKLKITPELRALMKYSNLKFISIQHDDFPFNTPLGSFFINNKKIFESKFVIVHMSDAYRMLILWKYGGVYYDTDVISLKSAESFPDNFACDAGNIISNGIMRFDRTTGRNFTEMFMNYMMKNYVADEYGANGPITTTNVLTKICQTTSVRKMVEMENCNGFHILPKNICYPIRRKMWKKMFNEVHVYKMLKLLNNAITLHLWNNLSKRRRIETDKDTLFNRIANDKCPEVFNILNSKKE